MIEEDISLGRSYCVVADGRVIGTFALIDDGEPTYERIYDGGWLTSDDAHSPAYLAIHRVAIAVSSRGSGVSTRMINYAVSRAEELGRASLRIDTHKGNVRMLSLLRKLGFKYVGVVRYDSGEREAFDMNLNNN
jgi:RimJ/RimL family protein N-acetyltransferase